MVGSSSEITKIRKYLSEIASSNIPVLITGETGTGKELAAAMLHEYSPRSKYPFIKLNSAAIPDTLVESQLFGHEKGVFTGATTAQAGLFAAARGGTIFFDEIGDMSLSAQPKILRVLESGEVQRLGSAHSIPVNVRVVAATNQPLEELVRQGKFRRDLFYRLNGVEVVLPPLRERKGDIPELIGRFIDELNAKMMKRVVGLDKEVHDCLMEYNWPGNVRELKSFLEATLGTLRSPIIGFKDLPEQWQVKLSPFQAVPFQEREKLVSALAVNNGDVTKTAKQLGCCRQTIYRKIEKYDIKLPRAAKKGWPCELTWMI